MTKEVNINHQNACILQMLDLCNKIYEFIDCVESGNTDFVSFANNYSRFVNCLMILKGSFIKIDMMVSHNFCRFLLL